MKVGPHAGVYNFHPKAVKKPLGILKLWGLCLSQGPHPPVALSVEGRLAVPSVSPSSTLVNASNSLMVPSSMVLVVSSVISEEVVSSLTPLCHDQCL